LGNFNRGCYRYCSAIVLTQIFGYGEDTAKQADETLSSEQGESEKNDTTENTAPNEEEIAAPLSGKLMALSEVPDEVFSSGAMGQGVAVEPSNNEVTAPADGKIVFIAPSKHAVGVRTNSGVELLIHVGLETVELNGEPFTVHVEDGQGVHQGDPLITFDQDMIREKGLPTITPVIITNIGEYEEAVVEDATEINTGDRLLSVIK